MATENVEAPTQEGHRVYIGNLSFSTTEEQVREHLATAGGKVLSVELPTKFGGRRPGGFGFAAYEKEEDAKAVVEKLNGSELDGRKVKLSAARTKEETEVHRAALNERRDAGRAARDAAKAEKAAAAGDTTAVTEGDEVVADGEKKKKKKPSKKRAPRRRQPGEEGEEGATAEATEGAEGADGEVAKPKARRARKPKEPKEARIDADGDATEVAEKPKRERKPRLRSEPTGEVSKTQIFVANLPFDLDDEGLTAIFTNLSINVKSAKVATRMRKPRNKEEKATRSSRGYGFVEVEDAAQQQEAVDKVEGTVVGERTISAKVANEMRRVEIEEVAKDVKEAGDDAPEVAKAISASA